MSTMPAGASSEDIELVLIGLAELQQIAAGDRVEHRKAVFDGALPPGHVATLALAEMDAGTPHRWCMPFLIVSASRNAILGSCRFKTVPVEGEVEISYGVAREVRGQGIGTAAIARLLQLASADRSVRRVIAHILPGNEASTSLVRRLGFVQDRLFTDVHGDQVARWVWTVPPEA